RNAKAGSGSANFIGAFDMSGNVLEFCRDWFEPRYSAVKPGKRATGPVYGSDRVCRGGSYSPLTIFSSAGDRYHYDPNEYYEFMGFRIVRSLNQ
ncbi:MAG: SUMF1/EgtB/PvdO family nonheme iron enzyme, partial [Treponema sp.]|nr:SUMF1/EgtB/PvdO family nonheme iron enzyme [Treponema sp.]